MAESEHSTEHSTEHSGEHSTEHSTEHSGEHSTEHSSDYSIEEATLQDLNLLAALFDGYRQFYKQQSNVEAAAHFIRERLERSESVLFIAKNKDGVGLGFTQLYPMFSSVRLKRIWVLNDLYVSVDARKKGIANALMCAAEDWGRSQGAAGLELSTAKDNERAKSVYEARGWTQDHEYDHYSITL